MHTLYQENLLDHYRNPRNWGSLPHPTHRGSAENPTCGDKLEVDIDVWHDKIKAIRFRGSGCAVSQASASLLSEHVLGMKKEDVLSLTKETTFKLVGVPLSPVRVKCALLSLETLQQAVINS